jgi:hypothetical protein
MVRDRPQRKDRFSGRGGQIQKSVRFVLDGLGRHPSSIISTICGCVERLSEIAEIDK